MRAIRMVLIAGCGLAVVASILPWQYGLQVRAEEPGADQPILIAGVPHVRQLPDFCGEACTAMYLQKLGHAVTQEQVFNLAGVDAALGRGCVTADMARVLKRIGFQPGPVWYRVYAAKAAGQLGTQWTALLADLKKGIPSIVCNHYDEQPRASEHFRLVLGYDAKSDEVIYHEPAEENGGYLRMKRDRFLKLWPLKYDPHCWQVIRMRLEPGTLTLGTPSDSGITQAHMAQHMIGLRGKVPTGFTVVLQKPFVVIGDEEPGIVRRRAEQTVKWFTDRIQALYFKKDPPAVYDVWLFRDDRSYRKHAKALFGDEPGTPFGYFSQTHGSLIMNIATGGGTLCHEMVHAFMPSNFPNCPAWFNEGLGSLYEQSGERNGRVVGLLNWRLAGLKKQIRAGTLPSFKELVSTDTQGFYGMRTGDNYAQARYLCYYLQEKDLLVKYYNAFCTNVANDPTGYDTLKGVLSVSSDAEMKEFQNRWEKWVLTRNDG